MSDDAARSDSHSDATTSTERDERRNAKGQLLCRGVKKNGEPCGALALGDAYGDDSHLCAGHAGLGHRAKAAKAAAPDGQGVGGAHRTARTPIDVLRERVEADPEKYVRLWEKAAAEGRDVRALTKIFELIYADTQNRYVPEPHSFDEFAKLSREDRRHLIARLEREGRGSPFRAPESL